MKILSAKYLLPISAEPIINGAIVIEESEITAVGTKQKLVKDFPSAEIVDFGDAVILPGFINCHSHLELTAMRGFLDRFDDDFSSWLITLTKTRAEKLSDEDIKISAMLGALEGVKAGVTCFGDIGRFGEAGFEALRKNGLRGVLFQETDFAPDNADAETQFEKLLEKFSRLKEKETELVEIGISPHAPYTVSKTLFEKIADYAIAKDIKLTIHAAESVEESNLMQSGEGFFADIYKEQRVNWESPRSSTIEYLDKIGVLNAKPLLAHCVNISKNDLEIIAQGGSSIAHCPKSNAKFGHGIAPLERFLDLKIAVGLGSDSMASNNNCDLLEEARFASLIARTRSDQKRFIHPREIIETSTIGGAKALGLEEKIGSLEVGKQADVIAISLESVSQKPVHDVYSALVFGSSGKDVVFTMVAGKELYRDGQSRKIDEEALISGINEITRKVNGDS